MSFENYKIIWIFILFDDIVNWDVDNLMKVIYENHTKDQIQSITESKKFSYRKRAFEKKSYHRSKSLFSLHQRASVYLSRPVNKATHLHTQGTKYQNSHFIYKPIFQPITLINHPKTAQPRTKRPRIKLKKKSTLKLLKMFENKMRILVLWIGKSAETSLTCSTTLQNPSRVEIRARRRLFRGNFQSKKKDDNRRL